MTTQPGGAEGPARGRRPSLLTGGAILLLFVGLVLALNVYWQPAATRAVRLNLTGTPGLKVVGTYTADGVEAPFEGVLPTSINTTARDFAYQIRIAEGQGEIKGELFIEGATVGMSATSGRRVGVRGGSEVRGG